MYIAFKWLCVMALGMWLTLCWKDLFLTMNKDIHVDNGTGYNTKSTVLGASKLSLKNITIKKSVGRGRFRGTPRYHQQTSMVLLHYVMFFAGALMVTVFNRKSEIFSYTKRKLTTINIHALRRRIETLYLNLNKTATLIGVAIFGNIKTISDVTAAFIYRFQNRFKQQQNRSKLNVLLLRKLKEIMEERNNLGQLLIAAIQGNKNIRMQYQLETMAKNRLIRHIEDTQKKIKENRSRYINFQHLYVLTHQENIFLKARVKRLAADKEEAEQNVLRLVNEIYLSKNYDLKAYCNRFIVKSKDNLVNSDVSAEILKFLKQPRYPTASTSNWHLSQEPISVNLTKSWPSTRVAEIVPDEDSLVLLNTNEPKLKGLPGEYVWTVKDKNGIIEKLYEYDYGYTFDSVDTIRRIREYSVYHDKDCLLDFSNSRSVLSPKIPDAQCTSANVEYPTRQRFLTESEPFQKFLKDNVVTSRSQAPPVLCG